MRDNKVKDDTDISALSDEKSRVVINQDGEDWRSGGVCWKS